MKFREIHRRIRTESAYMNPILLGICAGVAVLLGAIFTTNLIGRPAGFLLPRTALRPLRSGFRHSLESSASAKDLSSSFAKKVRARAFRLRARALLRLDPRRL